MTRKQIENKLKTLKTAANVQANKWRELVGEMQQYFDDRSEKWQEGDSGDEYQAWIDSVEEQADALDEVADFSLDQI